MKEFYNDYVSHIVSHPWFYWCLGGIGLLFILLIIVTFFRGRAVRVFRDESGHASVSRHALKDLVHLACDRIGTPSKPKIKFSPRRGRLDLNVRVKLYEGQRLSEMRDKLRRSVIRTFEETHGIRLGDINVIVTGFKKGGPGAPVDLDLETETLDELESVEEVTAVHESVVDVIPEATEPESFPEPEPAKVSDDFFSEEATEPEAEPKKKRSFFSWGKKADSEDEVVPSDDADDSSGADPLDKPEESSNGLFSSDSDKKS